MPNDPSAILGEKLLQGWAMLAQHCPTCYSPLMRNKNMEISCVVCDIPYRIEDSIVIIDKEEPVQEEEVVQEDVSRVSKKRDFNNDNAEAIEGLQSFLNYRCNQLSQNPEMDDIIVEKRLNIIERVSSIINSMRNNN